MCSGRVSALFHTPQKTGATAAWAASARDTVPGALHIAVAGQRVAKFAAGTGTVARPPGSSPVALDSPVRTVAAREGAGNRAVVAAGFGEAAGSP